MTEHDDEHPNPLGELDLFLFNEGTHRHLHRCLGAHPDADGTWFAVWAPTARSVEVLGDFDGWTGQAMAPVGQSGLWSARIDGARIGQSYRYAVTSGRGERIEKSDPLAAANNEPPSTASVIADLSYEWGDDAWMTTRRAHRAAGRADLDLRGAPRLVGSPRHTGPSLRALRRAGRPAGRSRLRRTVSRTSSCCPVMEHPFYGSWGYQTTGYFAPTARYGAPQDLMRLIDRLHQRGVGVILDWVPSHFPMDPHGLARFDGTYLYEHADPRQGFHPDWTSAIFNYGRQEVRAVPDLQRAALARPVPRRRTARGCGRVDAVSRLLAQRGRVGAQPVRWAGEPRRDRLPAPAQRRHRRRVPGCRSRSPRSRPRGRWSRGRRPAAGSGSRTSGTWGGCTTRCSTCGGNRCTGASTTTRSRSVGCTRSASATCCRCRTTRSSTARARCSGRCPATSGSASPTCACCTG